MSETIVATAKSGRPLKDATLPENHPVNHGRPRDLTERELQVAHLIAFDGLSDVEIAEALDISRRTVEKHVERIKYKLVIPNRSQILRALQTRGSA